MKIQIPTTLPEEWDLKTIIIRDNASLDDVSLNEIYGRLKTHDLEQRKNRKSTRIKSVILNVKAKFNVRASGSARKKAKYMEISDSEVEVNSDANVDDDSDSDLSGTEIKEMVSMIMKGFKKTKYRKFASNNSKKVSSDTRNERYKKKDDKENKSGKFNKSKVK